jgi:ribonuclease VapC
MIVDSSVLVAILKDEQDSRSFFDIMIAAQGNVTMSAACYLEAAIVTDRAPLLARANNLDQLIKNANITIAPVTETQARIARKAYQQYGKGSGHKAQLNFGDCFAYALAKDAGRPLLYKGNDFAHTDIKAALV